MAPARLRGRDARGARRHSYRWRISRSRRKRCGTSRSRGSTSGSARSHGRRGRRATREGHATTGKGSARTVDVDVLASPSAAGRSRPACSRGHGVALDKRGFIEVDDSAAPRLPASGRSATSSRADARAQGHGRGRMVAELIAGHVVRGELQDDPVGHLHAPEIAWVGPDRGRGAEVRPRGTSRQRSRSRPTAARRPREQATGFVKLIADARARRRARRAHRGPGRGRADRRGRARDGVLGIAEDLQRTIHAHPTLSEAMHEAALAADKRVIHGINR